MGTNSKLNILIVTPFALWMYIICISNIIMQELSGALYVAGLITYVSAFIICWLLYPDNNMFTAKVRRIRNIFINMPFVLFLPTRISSDFSVSSYIFFNNIQII
jgi:hypothetical protein